MATYIAGPTGAGAQDGSDWANRLAGFNAVEDVPVVAGDLAYFGPGVYREKLTADVGGGAGTEIVFVADVTGEHTDGVGGVVRISGSDNDQTETRDHCVEGNGIDYRTFRGFTFDATTNRTFEIVGSPTNWLVEDCVLFGGSASDILYFDGDAQDSIMVRRCVFPGIEDGSYAIVFRSALGIQDTDHVVENCIFLSPRGAGVKIAETGGVEIRNCLFMTLYGVRVTNALPGGYTAVSVKNCILYNCYVGLRALNLGEVVEDFNTFYNCATDRTNVAIGGNSKTYPPLFLPPLLHAGASQASGFKFPWWFGELSEWSQIRAITGGNEPSVDLHGVPRPATASKNSWGPCQFVSMEVESGTVQAGSYSRVIHDAGQVLVRRIPVTGVQITVTLYIRREANYAGSLPRMVIKQPGQADRTDTMVAAVNTWEQLSDTFTPSAAPGFIEVWAESRNTSAAGNYEVFYDTMGVS